MISSNSELKIKLKKVVILKLVLILCLNPVILAAENLGLSLFITKSEIGINRFVEESGVDGRGITVAVIDTGVDPAHPDLMQTTDGYRKIIDWVDFTNEGLVQTPYRAVEINGEIITPKGNIRVGGINSRSGVFHYGFFREYQIEEKGFIGQDVNRDGDNGDSFFVGVVDSKVAGFYDAVWVDTDGDNDLTDEKPLKVFSKNYDWALFGKKGNKVLSTDHSSFVVTEIDPRGGYVKLGFDGNGHGTHVAGILGGNGKIKGIAPGVRIMALKALGSSGDGSWEDISKAMKYAAANGADIVSISIGTTPSGMDGTNSHIQLMNYLSTKYNTLFVIAAGNGGPGLSSTTVCGDVSGAIIVGAYISPRIWKLNYNYDVPYEGLWYFSGMGPQKNGGIAPDVVAPGSVVSTVNIWDSGGYHLLDGTSMAVPHVVGLAALLMERAKKEGIDYGPEKIKKAITMGARSIDGFQFFEQGFGLVDINRAWYHLQRIKDIPRISIKTYTPGVSAAKGIYLRGDKPGRLTVSMINTDSENAITLKLSSDVKWIKPDRERIILPRGKERKFYVDFKVPQSPGVYCGFVYGDDAHNYGKEVVIPITIVQPYTFTDGNNYKIDILDSVRVGRWKRYYFNIDSSVNELNFSLHVQKAASGVLNGRVRMHVINPLGKEVVMSDYAGVDFVQSRERIESRITQPMLGVWEVVVYCDPQLSEYGMMESRFRLSSSIKGIVWEKPRFFLSFSKAEPVSMVSESINVKNYFKNFTGKVVGLGVVEESHGKVERIIEIQNQDIKTGPLIEVSRDAFLLKLKIDDTDTNKSDIDLYLYYYDEEKQEWEQVGVSSTFDESRESIEILHPKPGKYVAYIDGYSIPVGKTRVKYEHQVFNDCGNIVVMDDFKQHHVGEAWEVPLHIAVPKDKGSYIGYLMMIDEKGDVLSTIPINIKIQQKELLVTASLLNTGDTAVFGFYDGVSLQPVDDLPVKINQMLFKTENGIVTLPLNDSSRNSVEVLIDHEGYSMYKKIFFFKK